ncbi:MAG: EAL domain-containing protein, partial [Candidatus Competibacteraceae bacterium]|nr:EAL domain-containing protein [Candidatus Competibacteraceae bacterium]
AESSGLIIEIGIWALREACRQNQAWREAELFKVPIAVNLSAVQIHHNNLLMLVQQILAETNLPATELELEVTESLLVDHNQTVLERFRELKQLGVKFSIDDFGTGYSSLAYLKRFPVDKLKIDQSFIRDIVNDPDDLAIARTVVSMGHGLRLGVIAEGVEDEETVCLLRAIHCNEAQGYFFAKPMPAAQIPQWLNSRSLNT